MIKTEKSLRRFPLQFLAAITLLATILSACTWGTPSLTPEPVIKDTATPVPPTAGLVPPTVFNGTTTWVM